MTNVINESIILEEGCSLTTNPHEAIYILENGLMISGDFDCGIRGTDHAMIESFISGLDRNDGAKFWDTVHNDLKVVRTVPETMFALILVGQKITEQQQQILTNAGYEIHEY